MRGPYVSDCDGERRRRSTGRESGEGVVVLGPVWAVRRARGRAGWGTVHVGRAESRGQTESRGRAGGDKDFGLS